MVGGRGPDAIGTRSSAKSATTRTSSIGLGVLLEQGPLGPDLRSELTLLARAVLQVHDRQMPLMIALQRGDGSLDDLRVRRAKRSSTAAIATRRAGSARRSPTAAFPTTTPTRSSPSPSARSSRTPRRRSRSTAPHSPSTRPGSSTPGSRPGSESPAPPNTTATPDARGIRSTISLSVRPPLRGTNRQSDGGVIHGLRGRRSR